MQNSELKNSKKVLLIAPVFFGYYKEMLSELERQGYEAEYICDMASNSNLLKAAGRVNKKLTYGITDKYFKESVLPVVQGKSFDCVLVIGGMTFAFSPEMVEEIRLLQSNAEFVLYQWDSEKNLPYSTSIHKYFDRIYTFDRPDSISEPDKYRLLALFYLPEYSEIAQKDCETKYDCSYVGTAHPRKYKEVNEIAEAVKEAMPRQFIFHYMPSRLKYIYHKLRAPEYKHAKYRDFQTEKLSKSETLEIMAESKCILDAPQGGQTGLTIRTIECLGAKKKLITSNADVQYYDFYKPVNILIYNEAKKIDVTSPFFTEAYEEIPEEIYEKYSLSSWIKTLIEG